MESRLKSSSKSNDNHDLQLPPPSRLQHSVFENALLVRAAIIASLGGILFGYDLGVISGALPQLKQEFNLSDTDQEIGVSVLYVGSIIGACYGGAICDAFGRKRAILIVDGVFVVGAICLVCAQSWNYILVGRFILGIAVSISGIADVAYLTEISPPRIRGAIVSCNEACISLGFLLSYLLAFVLSQYRPQDGWRFMFGMAGIVASIQFIGMSSMPESPQWLLENDLEREAIESFRCLSFGDDYINSRLAETRQNYDTNFYKGSPLLRIEAESTWLKAHIRKNGMKVVEDIPSLWQMWTMYKKQVYVSIMLAFSQQLCGHGTILNFAPEIFAQVGFGSEHSLGSTILLGVIKVCVTFTVTAKIEAIGRRTLLISGLILINLSLSALIIAFDKKSDEEESNATFAVAGTVGVVVGYAISFGPLTWLVTSEMFETKMRGRALGASTVMTYMFASIVSYTFLSGQKHWGNNAPFILYLSSSLCCLVFFILAVPETAEKSPADIDKEMNSMAFWKFFSGNYSSQV